MEPSPSLFGSAVRKWRALRPVVLLAALFAAELICLSTWLDTATLSDQTSLLAAAGTFGPRILRVVVAFSLVFVPFASLRAAGVNSPPVLRIRWSLLSLHAAGMLCFAGLSFLLFTRQVSPAASNLAVLCWVAAGLAAIPLAALAFLPLAAWIRMIRPTGFLWVYALATAIAVGFAGDVVDLTWKPLWKLTFRLVQVLLGLFVSPVLVDPKTLIVRAPRFSVLITPQCAGFEGIGLILAFGMIWLILFRKEIRFPQALLLLPAGAVFIYLLNAIRITVLLLIGNAGAPRIALGGFHSQAGWIAFTVASLGFCFAARHVSWIAVRPVNAEPAAGTNPTAAYLIPFLAILAAGMLATALSAGFEWLYCLRFFAAAAALWFYRDAYRTLCWRFSWRGPAAGAVLFLVWIAMDRWSGVPAGRAMPTVLAAAPAGLRMAWIGFRALAAVVTVPIAEELAFRGFLLRRLRAADFEGVKWSAVSWTALAISSLLFGMLHGPRWPAGTLAGLLFGWLAMRQAKIGEAVAAHAAANALIALYVLAAGQWQLW